MTSSFHRTIHFQFTETNKPISSHQTPSAISHLRSTFNHFLPPLSVSLSPETDNTQSSSPFPATNPSPSLVFFPKSGEEHPCPRLPADCPPFPPTPVRTRAATFTFISDLSGLRLHHLFPIFPTSGEIPLAISTRLPKIWQEKKIHSATPTPTSSSPPVRPLHPPANHPPSALPHHPTPASSPAASVRYHQDAAPAVRSTDCRSTGCRLTAPPPPCLPFFPS